MVSNKNGFLSRKNKVSGTDQRCPIIGNIVNPEKRVAKRREIYYKSLERNWWRKSWQRQSKDGGRYEAMGCLEFSLGIETVQNARLWETFGAWNRYIRRRCEFLLRGNIDLPPSEIYNISARYVVTLCRISRIELNILCHIHFFFFYLCHELYEKSITSIFFRFNRITRDRYY